MLQTADGELRVSKAIGWFGSGPILECPIGVVACCLRGKVHGSRIVESESTVTWGCCIGWIIACARSSGEGTKAVRWRLHQR
jgi:hypothetical protein